MIKYGIYQIRNHDVVGEEKPQLHRGWFDTFEEAEKVLNESYNGGKEKRYDNDFYGIHYSYRNVIYAVDTDFGLSFYDMDDYACDLVNSGKWDELTEEQKSMISKSFLPHTILWMMLNGKINLKTNERY